MKKQWHRVIFLLLMIGLPLFAAAAADVSFNKVTSQPMSLAQPAHTAHGVDCDMPCVAEHGAACELGQACTACVPSANDSGLARHLPLPSAYQALPVHYPPSHISGVSERPPSAG